MRPADDLAGMARLLALLWLLCGGAILLPAIQGALLFGQPGGGAAFLALLAPPGLLMLLARALAAGVRRA
jgi:hypothetical protein